jgi:folate-binding protein YgfZ
MGSDVWQMARVMAGRPASGSELTEDFNPLEAGLYHAVSVQKGCYIGQETISKV